MKIVSIDEINITWLYILIMGIGFYYTESILKMSNTTLVKAICLQLKSQDNIKKAFKVLFPLLLCGVKT